MISKLSLGDSSTPEALTNLISLHDLTTSRAAQFFWGFLGWQDLGDWLKIASGLCKKSSCGSMRCLFIKGMVLKQELFEYVFLILIHSSCFLGPDFFLSPVQENWVWVSDGFSRAGTFSPSPRVNIFFFGGGVNGWSCEWVKIHVISCNWPFIWPVLQSFLFFPLSPEPRRASKKSIWGDEILVLLRGLLGISATHDKDILWYGQPNNTPAHCWILLGLILHHLKYGCTMVHIIDIYWGWFIYMMNPKLSYLILVSIYQSIVVYEEFTISLGFTTHIIGEWKTE